MRLLKRILKLKLFELDVVGDKLERKDKAFLLPKEEKIFKCKKLGDSKL